MAEPINHDAGSTIATVGTNVVKWGAIGLLAVPLLGAGLGALLLGGTIGLSTAAVGGAIAATVTALATAPAIFGAGAIGGSLLGLAKGGQQLSEEKAAFRERVEENMHKRESKTTKAFNEGEIKGIQEGYQIARTDLEAQAQKREQLAFQKGQEFVVHQIQEHMSAAQAAQATEAMPAANPQTQGKFTSALASCKCESKVEMVDKQRAEAAAGAPHIA